MINRNVQLQNVDMSALLAEVTRAYMHSSCPSALLTRLLDGLALFMAETNGPQEDRDLTVRFITKLLVMRDEWRAIEEETYSEPSTIDWAKTTTEDLRATIENYPNSAEAKEAAVEWQRRTNSPAPFRRTFGG